MTVDDRKELCIQRLAKCLDELDSYKDVVEVYFRSPNLDYLTQYTEFIFNSQDMRKELQSLALLDSWNSLYKRISCLITLISLKYRRLNVYWHILVCAIKLMRIHNALYRKWYRLSK